MLILRNRLRTIVVAILCVNLTACMVGPDFHRPEAPQIKSYTNSPLPQKTVATKTAGNAGVAQTFNPGVDIPAQWWTLFHNEALNQLIQTGITNNPSLAAAQATLNQAKYNYYAQVSSLMFPSVGATAGGERQKSQATSTTPPGTYNVYNTSVNVSYTLDIFGGNRRQLEALSAQADYQRYEMEAAYLTLTSNIVTTAVTVASLQAQVQATQQMIDAQQKLFAITTKQLRLGGISNNDLLAQTSQLAQLRATLPPLQKSLAQAQNSLSVLVGQFPGNAQLPVIKLDDLTLPDKLPVSLPSNLVRQRPDIQASEALLHAASAQVGVATANMFPQITLSAGYGWTAGSPGALFGPASSIWNFGGQLAQPIFQAGALQFKRKAAVEGYNAALAQYKQTVLQSFQNVADTLQALDIDAANLQAQSTAEATAKQSLVIAQRQYKVGGVSYLGLLNAQEKYQQARINYIQAQALRYNDTVALFQALGGGWWNKEPQVNK